MGLRSRLALGAVLLLAAVGVYGFFHQKLLSESLLTPLGQHHLYRYTLGYWIGAAVLLWFAPRWLSVAAASFVVIYTVWWSGFAAPLAVFYFLGACFLTGRILVRGTDGATATVLGLAVWLSAVWLALHFPVNTRPIYAAVFAIPYVWESRRLREHVRGFRWRCESRREAAALAVLLFLLVAHWLIALKPEISADGRSMHLALPMKVAQTGHWDFDYKNETWTLMPAGGDSIFTAAYVLAGDSGGEAAAKLTNFALLVLICTVIAQTSRRWLTSAQALLVAALFASTPLVELVTGSLFVENTWAVLILCGTLALVRYDEAGKAEDLQIMGALFGTALAVKLIAAVFLAPTALMGAWIALRRRNARALFSTAWWMLVLGIPPYLYAFVRSGNPVFPFANTIFRSPYFDTQNPFYDPRFMGPLSWRMPYDMTFRSNLFFEGQAGAAGFQYFLLLVPAMFLLRKRAQWLILAVGASATMVLFAELPNLRYLYPALPLFSIVIGVLLCQWSRAGTLLLIGFLGLAALNLWFFPASGWYHSDFAYFKKRQAADYLREGVPAAALIERLNRDAPGEPVAFFSTDAVAGLHGTAYTDSWHTNPYWTRLLEARNPAGIAAILREYGIRHIVAPVSPMAQFPVVDAFLKQWLQPDVSVNGTLGLFRLREAERKPVLTQPLPAGSWDDLDERISYDGAWSHDLQFSQTFNHSVTYSAVPGDRLQFSFVGSGIAYVFTEAVNRGIAVVTIDGTERAHIDEYSAQPKWQTSRAFDGLGEGTHTFEVRVSGEKNPQASGAFVDLDEIVVGPAPAPPPVQHLTGPLPPGSWDDLDERIVYRGAWLHDHQFTESLHRSLSYSTAPGDGLSFSFTGSGITYIFTEAVNRGVARVLLDGKEVARIDEYSAKTKWRQSRNFNGLEAGPHTFEIQVLGSKNPDSSGAFVDLDGIIVRR